VLDARLASPAEAAALRQALDSADPRARVDAIRALGRLPSAQGVEWLAEAATGDVDADVRREAVSALGRILASAPTE
jgi:HEAT repeat protein